MNNETAEHIIILKGLEGNQPTHLTNSQTLLKSHVETIAFIWWTLFFTVLIVVIFRAIVLPLVRKRN